MDARGEDDLFDALLDLAEVDQDHFVVAIAIAGEVVSRMFDGTVGAFEVVVKDEVAVADDFATAVGEEKHDIQVKCSTGKALCIPAEAGLNLVDTG